MATDKKFLKKLIAISQKQVGECKKYPSLKSVFVNQLKRLKKELRAAKK